MRRIPHRQPFSKEKGACPLLSRNSFLLHQDWCKFVLRNAVQSIYHVIKVPQWYAAQGSDTTMLPNAFQPGQQILKCTVNQTKFSAFMVQTGTAIVILRYASLFTIVT